MSSSWLLVLFLCASLASGKAIKPHFLFNHKLIFNILVKGITGGEVASANEFSYTVSILLDGRHHCSGFIYSELFIVTTASCVVTVEPGLPP